MRRGIIRVAMVAVAVAASTSTVALIQSAGADPTPSATSFVPITPCRLFDTRPGDINVGPRSGALGAGETLTVDVHGTTGNGTIPTSATAVTLNVVSIETTAASRWWSTRRRPLCR